MGVEKKCGQSRKGFKRMDYCFPAAILPDGYEGKILLVLVGGDGIEDTVVLRSGDIWHSEILRATEVEIRKYGIKAARVNEAGGAWARFDSDGTIFIYGNSEEFGACDKIFAAGLLRRLYPERTVHITD
jgi:hypothetical protein